MMVNSFVLLFMCFFSRRPGLIGAFEALSQKMDIPPFAKEMTESRNRGRPHRKQDVLRRKEELTFADVDATGKPCPGA